ncbi:MAG: phage tail protein [Burkholderiales bacterium]
MPVRPVVASRFLLQLDGVSCGFMQSVEGGAATADVIQEVGPEFFVKKHLGAARYEDITVQAAFSMGKPLYEWITASLQMKAEPMNGAIILADHNFEARSEQQFFNALISEVGFPACDGASKDPAYFTVRFAPERTRYVKASGKVTDKPDQKQKSWISSNFRLKIDALDCSKVAKIDAFTVKQANVPGKLEFPNLTITLPEASAETWRQWHEDFVINGNNGEAQQRHGTLEFISANLQGTLLSIALHNLGIFKLTPERSEVGADKVSRMSAALYCERMEFTFG